MNEQLLIDKELLEETVNFIANKHTYAEVYQLIQKLMACVPKEESEIKSPEEK